MAIQPVLNLGERRIEGDRIIQRLSASQFFPQLLREMAIDEVLAATETSAPQDFAYTPSEFDRYQQQIAEITPFRGMNSQQIQAIALRTLKLQKFKQRGWGYKVESYFEERKAELDRVSFSMLVARDGELAQELFFRIVALEQSFGEVGFLYPETVQVRDGSAIGPMLMRDLSPAIGQMLRQLTPGRFSSLFEIDGSYGFLRLDEFYPAELDERMQQFLLDELFEEWLQSHLALEVGVDRSHAPHAPLVLPKPQIAIASAPELALSEIDLTMYGNSSQTEDIPTFTPEFSETETTLLPEPTDQLTGLPITAEVSVVREPELEDIEISTSFFFPNLRSHTRDRVDVEPSETQFYLPPVELNYDREPFRLAEVQHQLRRQKISTAIGLLIAIVLGGIALDRFLLPGSISKQIPATFKPTFRTSDNVME